MNILLCFSFSYFNVDIFYMLYDIMRHIGAMYVCILLQLYFQTSFFIHIITPMLCYNYNIIYVRGGLTHTFYSIFNFMFWSQDFDDCSTTGKCVACYDGSQFCIVGIGIILILFLFKCYKKLTLILTYFSVE